jgi:hypothetical protein
VAGVVQLVEHHERVVGHAAQREGLHGDLLVGDDDAVHVAREAAVARRPERLEVQVEARRRPRPLVLQVLGRRHHDDPLVGVRRQVLHRCGEGERGLAGARSGHRQEVGRTRGPEALEGISLPGPQTDGTGHGGHRCYWRPPP